MFITLLECDAAKMPTTGKGIHERINSITGLLFVATEDIRPGACALIVKSTEVSFAILLAALKELDHDSIATLIAFTHRKPDSTPQFGLRLNGIDDFEQTISRSEEALSRASRNQNTAELYANTQAFEQAEKHLKTPNARFSFGATLFDGSKGLVYWSNSLRERSLKNGRTVVRWKLRTLVRPEGIQTLVDIYKRLHSDTHEFGGMMISFTYEKEGLLASIIVSTSVESRTLAKERQEYEAKLLKAIGEVL